MDILRRFVSVPFCLFGGAPVRFPPNSAPVCERLVLGCMPTHAQKRLAAKAEAAAAVSAAARPDADVVLVSATRGARATKGRRGPGHPMCDRRAGNMFQVKGSSQQDRKLTVIVKVGKSKT